MMNLRFELPEYCKVVFSVMAVGNSSECFDRRKKSNCGASSSVISGRKNRQYLWGSSGWRKIMVFL